MFWVYVIKNNSGKIYIGQTLDLETRLKRHNGILKSKPRSYTGINKGPWNFVYQEQHKTRSEALAKEKFLKSHMGRDWLKTILGP